MTNFSIHVIECISGQSAICSVYLWRWVHLQWNVLDSSQVPGVEIERYLNLQGQHQAGGLPLDPQVRPHCGWHQQEGQGSDCEWRQVKQELGVWVVLLKKKLFMTLV